MVPCIRLAQMKFELTNQYSAGGENFTVLTLVLVNRKTLDVRQLFSSEMTLNIHEKGFKIPKPFQIVKGEKCEIFCVSRPLLI